MYAVFVVLMISSPAMANKISEFSWPNNYKAAVSLTYDDALHTQLDNAIPALDKYGIKASFYLTMGSEVVLTRLQDWRNAASNGHELGNHTLYHSCSKSLPNRDWVKSFDDLDKKSFDEINREIDITNGFLKALDNKSERTYTPPCLETQAAEGNYVEVIRSQFIAIKGNNPSIPNKFDLIIMPDGATGEELINFVKKAVKQGGIANILFHGINGDHMSVSNKAHNELLQYLHDNRDSLWTDTYINIMKHVNSQFR